MGRAAGRPEWGREMDVTVRTRHGRRQGDEAERAERRLQRPAMISLAYHQASLVVEHLAAVVWRGVAHQSCCVRMAAASRRDAAIKELFNRPSLDEIQTAFDAKLERNTVRSMAALEAADGEDARRPRRSQAAGRRRTPGTFPVQMSLGRALAEAGDSAGAIAAFEQAAAARAQRRPATTIRTR